MKLKQLIPLVMLIAGAFLLNGCLFSSSNDVESTQAENYEFVTYEGILQSLGTVKFNPDATHLLRLEDGNVLYVYSNYYNLWSDDYLNKKVEVSGLLIPGEDDGDKPVLAIERLTVLPDEPEQETVVIDMETYTNDNLGFAVDYQSDWTFEDHSSAVTFIAPQPKDTAEPVETDEIQISLLFNKEGLLLEDWVTAYQNVPSTSYPKSVISVDKIDAITVNDDNSVTYYVGDDDRIYVITHLKNQEIFALTYSNLFKEVLLSFDLLSDGARELEVSSEENEQTLKNNLSANEIGGTDYESIINSLEKKLEDDATPVKYEFAEPNYIYVTYTIEDILRKILFKNLGGDDFEEIATFKEGATTDWVLDSGADEAKGFKLTVVNADTGQATELLEGYHMLESGTLNFQMQYPAGWYYSRVGSFYYFSDQPADATNSLMSLEIKDSPVAVIKSGNAANQFYVTVPRDDDSSFYLIGSAEYSEKIQKMGESIQTT